VLCTAGLFALGAARRRTGIAFTTRTMAAPHTSNWVRDKDLRGECMPEMYPIAVDPVGSVNWMLCLYPVNWPGWEYNAGHGKQHQQPP
jgi:hypothetical protein